MDPDGTAFINDQLVPPADAPDPHQLAREVDKLTPEHLAKDPLAGYTYGLSDVDTYQLILDACYGGDAGCGSGFIFDTTAYLTGALGAISDAGGLGGGKQKPRLTNRSAAWSDHGLIRGAADLGDGGAQGGVYRLVDATTGEVVRTGRSGDLARREREHGKASDTKGYTFEVIFRTDNYAEQRGLEQLAHEAHGKPRLNGINGISPHNSRRNHYLNAADDFLVRFGVG